MKITCLLTLLLAVSLMACGDKDVHDGIRALAPSTQQTVLLIDSIADETDYAENPTQNERLAHKYLERYRLQETPQEWARYVTEQARTGNFAQTSILQQNSFRDGQITADKLNKGSVFIYELMALGYLRVAMQNEGKPFIIWPPSPHDDPQYAQGAMQIYELILTKFPERVDVRWYYNLCHMMVGTYPDAVPADYYLPLDSLSGVASGAVYRDIAADLNINETRNGGPALWLDLDGDHDLDLITCSIDLDESIHVYRKSGSSYDDITAVSGVNGLAGGSTIAPADIDNDGDLDVFIGRGKHHGSYGQLPVSLLLNKGDCILEDIAIPSGMSELLSVADADWIDYDLDGDLDLFVATENNGNLSLPKLYQNQGDLTFAQVQKEVLPQIMLKPMRAVEMTQLCSDQRPDLLVTYKSQRPFLWSATDTTMRKTPSPMAAHQATSTILPVDVDNDGDLDVIMLPHTLRMGEATATFASGLLARPPSPTTHLYINQADTAFVPAHDQLGGLQYVESVYAATYFDADLDGDMDVYVSTGGQEVDELVPNRLFYNDGNGGFSEATITSGTGLISQSYGLAVANIDTDPLPEILINGGGFYEGDHGATVLFDAVGSTDNQWLRIKLEGRQDNHFGIGARVAIHCMLGDTTEKVYYHYPDPGHGLSTRQVDLPIGLGQARAIDKVVVDWPIGGRQILTDIEVNQTIIIAQD